MFKSNALGDLATLVYVREGRTLKMTTTNGWSLEVDIKEVWDERTQSSLEFTYGDDAVGDLPPVRRRAMETFTYTLQMVGKVEEARISQPSPREEVQGVLDRVMENVTPALVSLAEGDQEACPVEEEEVSGHTVGGVAGNLRALLGIPEPWTQETRDDVFHYLRLLEGFADGSIRPYDPDGRG